jgi:formylglycine-generating enzyme required for sulfatase activity
MIQKLLIVAAGALVLSVGCEPGPPKPEWEGRYASARKDADDAFKANQYPKAADLFRIASEIPPVGDARRDDCSKWVVTSQVLGLKDTAKLLLTQGKPDDAVLALRTALAKLPENDSRRADIEIAIKAIGCELTIRAGKESLAKQSWAEAIKAFEASRDCATGAAAKELPELVDFCKRFQEADDAFLVKLDYAKAQAAYENLLKTPHGLTQVITEKLAKLKEAATSQASGAKAAKEKQFQLGIENGRNFLARGEWARAKEALDGAAATGITSTELEDLLKKAKAAATPMEGFVYVAAGKFRLGEGAADEVNGPEQDASTDAFYISKREVTNAQYAKFLEAYKDHSLCHEQEPAEKKNAGGHVPDGWSASAAPDTAVTGVDWYDAWAYARWAGGKLPSELEWEKAASWNVASGKKSIYPWGDDYEGNQGGPSPRKPWGAECSSGSMPGTTPIRVESRATSHSVRSAGLPAEAS